MSYTDNKSQWPIVLGLAAVEAELDGDTYIYVLRALYRIVLKSKSRQENSRQLQRRIKKFEEDSAFPGYLSSISIDRFLEELQDAQYLYPVRRKEIILPSFH